MTNADKTVFISYRRETSQFIARAIFMALQKRGFDAFMDVESINAGDFGQVLLNQIAARMHFVLILTPGTLERCRHPDDWLRREIEHALDSGRNIVPVMANDFTFQDADALLDGNLTRLRTMNAIKLYNEYFDAAMDQLTRRFLQAPNHAVQITPIPDEETQFIERTLAEVAQEPPPTQHELEAEQHFGVAIAKQDAADIEGAIAEYTEAIRINPQYHKAYYNRGLAYYRRGDLDNALADYSEAIRLEPQYAKPYVNRGIIRYDQGDYVGAQQDYSSAIDIEPEYVIAYNNRANARQMLKDLPGAVADLEKYLALNGGARYGNQAEVERTLRYLLTKVGDEIDSSSRRPLANLMTGEFEATQFDDRTTPQMPQAVSLPQVPQAAMPPPPTAPIVEDVTRSIDMSQVRAQYKPTYFTVGQSTNTGKVRKNNQDAMLSMTAKSYSSIPRPEFGLFLIADGAGGEAAGEQAAAIAMQTVGTAINQGVFMPMMVKGKKAKPDIGDILETSIHDANMHIIRELKEGGTTLTAAVIVDERIYLAHVGDTRAYLVSQREIKQLTTDHSLVQRMIEMGQLQPEEASRHPQRNVLYGLLGKKPQLEVDVMRTRFPMNSSLLLCSDGIWRYINERELHQLCLNMDDPQQTTEHLIDISNERGGADNMTVIIVRKRAPVTPHLG